jgi:hypothetical protein
VRDGSTARLACLSCVLLSVVALATCVTACGGSNSGAVSPAASTGSGPLATAPSTPVRAFHGMVPYVWTQSLTGRREDFRQVGAGREWYTVCTLRQESSDPRLSGTVRIVVNMRSRARDRSAHLWGTWRLRNQGGTWLGRWTGGIPSRASGAGGQPAYRSARGTGGYAGLVTRGSWWFPEAGAGYVQLGIKYVGAGWIETTDGDPVPPAPGPGTTPAYWTPVVGIATMRRTAYDTSDPWILDLEQSDPRVSGRLEGFIEEIGRQRSDRSIDYSAWSTLSNARGAWEAPAVTAVRGPGGIEHFQYWTSAGSDAYADLYYHVFWRFMERRPLAPGDTWIWAGLIEEAE